MVKVLVTGANGFVGQPLCQLLTERGYEVRAAVRSADKAADLAGESVVVGDVGAQTNWPLEGVDCIVHLLARVHVMNDQAADPLAEFRALNVIALERLARQAACAGVKRLVFVSSIKVNGESTSKDAPFKETDTPAPVDPYGVSKWEAEQLLQQLSRETGMEIVIVRPPLIYGPRVKGNFLKMLSWADRRVPLPVASARNRRSLISVGNFIDLLERCITHPAAAGKIFLASDGEDVSTPELSRRIAVALRKPAVLLPIPEGMLRMALRPLKREGMVDRLFGSLAVDSSYVRQTLDWSPSIPMQAALDLTVQWYMQRR